MCLHQPNLITVLTWRMVLAILESGTAYCTMHTAESGVRLGLAETESTRGRGLRFPFAKQEVRVVHLVLQTT